MTDPGYSEKRLYDMHSHLIPGVDDGASSMGEAIRLLEMEYAQGVRGLLLTPHFRRGMFETPSEVIRERFLALRQEAASRYPDIELFLGWEYHANQRISEDLRKSKDFRIHDSDYVLIEFSAGDNQKYVINQLRELMTMDLIPIIAHIERFPMIVKDTSFLETLKKNGVLFQVNADSVIGKEGFWQKRCCGRLLRDNMVDFIGSDAHDCEDRIPRIGECYNYLVKKLGKETAERIMFRNPETILKGTDYGDQ